MKIPNAIKVSALAMLVTAGLVLGTAGPANAGTVRYYGVNFTSASGHNAPVYAGTGSYDGLSYMTMLSNGKIYTDQYFGWPDNLFTVWLFVALPARLAPDRDHLRQRLVGQRPL